MVNKLTLLETSGGPNHVIAGEMAEKIKEIIYEYSDKVPLALVVGVLDIVKFEIMDTQ